MITSAEDLESSLGREVLRIEKGGVRMFLGAEIFYTHKNL